MNRSAEYLQAMGIDVWMPRSISLDSLIIYGDLSPKTLLVVVNQTGSDDEALLTLTHNIIEFLRLDAHQYCVVRMQPSVISCADTLLASIAPKRLLGFGQNILECFKKSLDNNTRFVETMEMQRLYHEPHLKRQVMYELRVLCD